MSGVLHSNNLLFLDTSVLLRAYLVKDPFYGQVKAALADAEQVVVSLLAHTEFTAALIQRQHRDYADHISAAQVTRLLGDFQYD